MAVFELLTLWMFGAMVRDIFSIQIFYSNCRADMDLVNLLEKKITNFATNVTWVRNLHDTTTTALCPREMLSKMNKAGKDSPSVFLLSNIFLDSVWYAESEVKDRILEYMLGPKALVLLMDDAPQRVLQKYSTHLVQKSNAKLSTSIEELQYFAVNELESYFLKKLLLMEEDHEERDRLEPGKYCIQTKKTVYYNMDGQGC